MLMEGRHTRFPISAQSKKHSCVSCSTPEAELISMHWAIKNIGIPSLDMWDTILQRQVDLICHEDNTTMIGVCKTGRNPTMRHIGRVHRIAIGWLFEQFRNKQYILQYTPTRLMSADIHTKAITEPIKYKYACSLINIFEHSADDEKMKHSFAFQIQAFDDPMSFDQKF